MDEPEQIGTVTLFHADCLDVLAGLPDASVNMVLCDLPYGATANRWDSPISLDLLWEHYKRVVAPHGVIVLTAQQPFSTVLGASNIKNLRHEWIWDKGRGSGFLNAKHAPLRAHEAIMVFSAGQPTFHPQMRHGRPYHRTQDKRSSSNWNDERPDCTRFYQGERYPLTLLSFPRDTPRLHPAQKPVALFAYLIRTYSTQGDVVLDNCAGSFTTAIACLETGRRSLCIERDESYYQMGKKRICDWHETRRPSLIEEAPSECGNSDIGRRD